MLNTQVIELLIKATRIPFADIANQMELSTETLKSKIHNKTDITITEIMKLCEILGLAYEEAAPVIFLP